MDHPRSVVLCCMVALVSAWAQEVKLYDAFFGKPLTEKRANSLNNVVNGTLLCTVPVRACKKTEGRRVDGTCTNPKHPSRGATLTPFLRLLPAHFGPGNSLRASKDGSPLPSTRVLRTALQNDGFVRDKEFSSLATDIFVFSTIDTIELLYLTRYAIVSDCCLNNQIPNVANPRCIPIPVRNDDPYLRRTGITCMNLTRTETYQDFGCISNNLPAERYNRNTPILDLSVIYGSTEARSNQIRARSGGLLAFRMEGDREVPAGMSPFCANNKPQNSEVSCYDFGNNFDGNAVLGMAFDALLFFREHNRIARKLALINPCWHDQQLFETARKINIAQWQYIFYYELIPEILGYKNALASGIIYETKGYVNDFNPKAEPGVYQEYAVGTRFFHNFQSGVADLYRNHTYIGSRTLVDDEARSGVFGVNNTEADYTFRNLYQPADKFDYVMDPDLSNRVYGELQAASDLPAIDMMRSRDAGFPPYNHYRKLCGLKPAKHFEDFLDTIDKDKVTFLSRFYNDVDDVDLMTAIYVERLIPDGFVGPTLHCIMTHNLLNWRHSDKFFFEHGDFHAALTERQLKEIRSTRIARIVCDNGVGVKEIQPHAFLALSPWNHFIPCDKIPGINFKPWKDHTCMREYDKKKK